MAIEKFSYSETGINGLLTLNPFRATDERGSFIKDYSSDLFRTFGIQHSLSEVFYTCSHKGVVRALHFQREKQQAKLVRCVKGRVFDVVVDLAPKSPTFLKYETFELSDKNNMALLIPSYCAHGYLVLEPSIVSYKCDAGFVGSLDDGIYWKDPTLAIDWPLEKLGNIEPILSDKDKQLQSLQKFLADFGGLEYV